jgi:hypothetical protein
MSVNAAEKVLWLLSNERAETDRFLRDSEGYLKGFRLDPAERESLEKLDVRWLADRGVNPLLLLGAYRAVKGPDSVPEYMRQMNSR